MKLIILLIALIIQSGCINRTQILSNSTLLNTNDGLQKKTIRINCQPEITISKNDSLIVQFIEYPGKGFSWTLDTPDTLLMNLRVIRIERHALADKDDPEQKTEFIFIGSKTGIETLNFRYSRPWEKTKPASENCIIKVIVR